jgi:tetratricopeptide (TPR) repeat protein
MAFWWIIPQCCKTPGVLLRDSLTIRERSHQGVAAGMLLSCVLASMTLATGQSTSQAPGESSAGDFAAVSAEAEVARNEGDAPKAVRLYTQALQLNPSWSGGWWYLGTLLYGEDQFDAARDAFTHYIGFSPEAGPAMALRGLCEFETGKFAESLEDIEAGIAHGALNQPRNAKILLYHEALALNQLGRFEEALGKEKALAQQSEENPEMDAMIGLSGLRRANLPKDVRDSDQPLIAAVGHAAYTMMTGNAEVANTAFKDLFVHYPDQPYLHYLRGYLLLTTDPESASAEFKLELRVDPKESIAQTMTAWSLGIQSEYNAALPYAKQAVEEDPLLMIGQLVYGRDLVETGDPASGLPHLEKVLKLEPGNLEAHMALAKALSKLGRSDEARHERLLCLSISEKEASPRATQ